MMTVPTQKRRRRRATPEQDFQIAAVEFITRAAPGLIFWFCPNGGNLSKVQARAFQRMGLRPGVPDLHFMLPNGRFGFMEMKSAKGSLSPAQRQFRDDARERGFPWAEVRTLEEVEAVLTEWLRPWGWTLKATVRPRHTSPLELA